MWLKCSLCCKNCSFPYSRAIIFAELPMTRTVFDFPWRFELSGVDCVVNIKKACITSKLAKKNLCFYIFTLVFDECKDYEQLDDSQRAAGVHRGNTLKCDQKDLTTPKWYRFIGNAGIQMPTSCVPIHYCGTHAPGWLSTPHPTSVGQIVNGTVCFNWGDNCCSWHANIQIKRCNGFYVYELVKTPVCWLRYCGNAGFGEWKGRTINCS